APLQPRRGGRAQDRGTHPARDRQDRRRRPGRQSPAVGHGCARLPAPARDPHDRSDRELAPGSARAAQELDLPPERQAHTPRPQDVRPAATLRARPRRVPPRTSLHRAPQSSAAQSLSISRAHAREPRPSEPSTVVLPSSPASSKVPTPDVARCAALLLIRHSSVSKQRPARRRTIKIRPQPLCAGSGFRGWLFDRAEAWRREADEYHKRHGGNLRTLETVADELEHDLKEFLSRTVGREEIAGITGYSDRPVGRWIDSGKVRLHETGA